MPKTRRGDYNDDGSPAVRVEATVGAPEPAGAADVSDGDGGLDGLTVAELKDMAAERGVEIEGRATRAKLVDALSE